MAFNTSEFRNAVQRQTGTAGEGYQVLDQYLPFTPITRGVTMAVENNFVNREDPWVQFIRSSASVNIASYVFSKPKLFDEELLQASIHNTKLYFVERAPNGRLTVGDFDVQTANNTDNNEFASIDLQCVGSSGLLVNNEQTALTLTGVTVFAGSWVFVWVEESGTTGDLTVTFTDTTTPTDTWSATIPIENTGLYLVRLEDSNDLPIPDNRTVNVTWSLGTATESEILDKIIWAYGPRR